MEGVAQLAVIAALASGLSAPARADTAQRPYPTCYLEGGAGVGMPLPAGDDFLNLIADVRYGRRVWPGSRWTFDWQGQFRVANTEGVYLSDHTYSGSGKLYRGHLLAGFRYTPVGQRTVYLRLGVGLDVLYPKVPIYDDYTGEPLDSGDYAKAGPAVLFALGNRFPVGRRFWIATEVGLGFNLWLGQWYPLLNQLPFDIDFVVSAGWSLRD